MHIIPRKVHAVLDYVVGLLLILAPSLFGFSEYETASRIAYIVGGANIAYSLLTAYELGAIKVLSFGTHLMLDIFSGIFLLASPWIFGFADQVAAPHVIVGLLEVGVALCSRREAFVPAAAS